MNTKPESKFGVIITGHGNFASGMESSLELIAGKQEDVAFVNFDMSDSTETLSVKLENAFETLSNCNEILILADLVGGTPFNTSVMHQVKKGNVQTVGGTNLPMIIEVIMSRSFTNSLDELKETALRVGKDSIVDFKDTATNEANNTEEDGI